MKKISLIVALFSILCATVSAQDGGAYRQAPSVPEAEVSFKSKAVYEDALVQLEDIVRTNPQDENAWLNYYKAARYRNFTSHSESITKASQKKLDDILGKMNNAVPNSYAWNYCSFINSNRSDNAVAYLKKAYEIRPYEKDLWDDMLAESVIAKDEQSTIDFTKKLEENAFYTDAAMEYSRNVLSSIEKDGILITNGSLDTYPILIFQKQHNYRTDVSIVCLDWIGSARYTEQLKGLFGLKKDKVVLGQPYTSLAAILQSSKKPAIYLALTIPPDILSQYLNELYCTGLAMKFSKKSLQNLGSLQYNWENLFQINSISASDDINRNYLVPLMLLKDYYFNSGNQQKSQEIHNRIDEIVIRFGLQSVIPTSKK